MFDISFSELLIIGIVALIVIGPERLPKVARTAGHLFGRLQRYVADVKADINRELQAEDLRKLQEEMRNSVTSLEQSVKKEMIDAGHEFHGVAEQIHEIVEIPRETATAAEAEANAPVVEEASQPQLELSLDTPPASPSASSKNS